METGFGFRGILYKALQQEFAFERDTARLRTTALPLCRRVSALHVSTCEPCVWPSCGAICVGEERQVIRSANLGSGGTKGGQPFGDLRDPCLRLSLVR